MKNKFWKLTNSVDSSGSTLFLDGTIASESWWGDEVTPQAFRDELKKIEGNKLMVIINSPGGDVWAGVAIHDALKELDKEVTVRISGLGASIASVIAMAGDVIEMTPGSTMMVHKASMIAWGNADDMKKAIEMLETVEEGIIDIYSERTGQTREAVQDMVNAETWMSAEKAVELGFADKVVKPEASEEADEATNSLFSGNFAFSMSATKDSMESFMSKVKAEQEEPESPAEEDAEDEETPTPDTPASEEPEEDEEEEVLTDPEAEEVVEDPAEENKSTEEKEEIVEENKNTPEDIAKGQVLPKNQAPVDNKPNPQDYLKTRASVEDFAGVLAKTAGGTAKEVKDAWGAHLVTMGITNPDILLPEALISSIEDAFKEGGEIWNLVKKTGLTVFRNAVDTVTGENSRAKGHTRGDDKAEEVITLADRTVRAQFIYKYIKLDKETIRENQDTGALVSYVLSELPRRIVREVERAIVIGDGRADDSDYKITSFLSLKADATADEGYVAQYVPAEDESKYESLLRARALVRADGAKWLVAKADWLTDLLLEQGVNGGYLFPPGSNLAQMFGFAGILEPDWMEEDEDNDAYIFTPSNYTTVGDSTVESFTNFILKENKQEYLQELYAGGAVTSLNAGVAIGAGEES